MRIKVWKNSENIECGSYKFLGDVERTEALSPGEMTEWGQVVYMLPQVKPFSLDAEQNVVIDPVNMQAGVENKSGVGASIGIHKRLVSILPIKAETNSWIQPDPLQSKYVILEKPNLIIEDVSIKIDVKTFSVWGRDCFLTSRDFNRLQDLRYAFVHQYEEGGESISERPSKELISLANACLSLIRPTRRVRIGIITGALDDKGMLDAEGFGLVDSVEVPTVQKLSSVGSSDVNLLQQIIPRFLSLYRKDSFGKMLDDFEPIRMAVQLYENAYSNSYWKARHILWWSAIEALYGNNEDSTFARVYCFLGNKDILAGYKMSIYDAADVPSSYTLGPDNDHTVGEVLPEVYKVRNSSAHGQKVADPHFVQVAHPSGNRVPLLEVLAEAATFIIRKTLLQILKLDLCDDFRDRGTRENFWLYKYGLDKGQSKKRLHGLKEELNASLLRDDET